MSSALALVSDISMNLLGGGLKRKERLSARMGDVLSNLYLGCAVLKYYRDNGNQEADLPYVDWNLQLALYNCQVAFNEFFENLPNRTVAFLLKRIVFPFGGPYRLPNDALEHEMVQSMLCDCELRDRLTQNMYIGKDSKDSGFVIEDAFKKLAATKTVRKGIRAGVKAGTVADSEDIRQLAKNALDAGLCSKEEAEAFVAAEIARDKAIQVDDFPAEHFQS